MINEKIKNDYLKLEKDFLNVPIKNLKYFITKLKKIIKLNNNVEFRFQLLILKNILRDKKRKKIIDIKKIIDKSFKIIKYKKF